MDEAEIASGNHTIFCELIEIKDLLPVIFSIDDNRHFLADLTGLDKREAFEEFIECTEAARKDYERLAQVREPELAHEEVMEFEVQFVRDVAVRHLLEGKRYVEAYGFPSCHYGTLVRGFHDAGSA